MERFDTAIEVEEGRILYKETIAAPVEGVGHFEPLRHYAEVHLLLEPLPQGSGLVFDSQCSEDVLERSWQRLILTHLRGKDPPGGADRLPHHGHEDHPGGRPGPREAHRGRRLPPGHLPGGAPGADAGGKYPAGALLPLPSEPAPGPGGPGHRGFAGHVRLLFPGRQAEELAVLTGSVPVSALGSYAMEVAAYTRGGATSAALPAATLPAGIRNRSWQKPAMTRRQIWTTPPDSVFCAHGAGFPVKWQEVPAYMHLESCLRPPLSPRLRHHGEGTWTTGSWKP